MKSGIFFSMAAAVLFCSLCGRAEDGVRLLGPGVGGACYALAIDPANPQTIIGGLDMGFAFRTADGGRSWQVLGGDGINPGYRGCFQAAFAPDNPSVAWIVSEHGAYRSEDNGKTFHSLSVEKKGGMLRYSLQKNESASNAELLAELNQAADVRLFAEQLPTMNDIFLQTVGGAAVGDRQKAETK